MSTETGIWSAVVRFAEVDGQNVVFNSHYLTYCDEAMSAFCATRGMPVCPSGCRSCRRR
jgi:acyl-CoA thioesterase FadM